MTLAVAAQAIRALILTAKAAASLMMSSAQTHSHYLFENSAASLDMKVALERGLRKVTAAMWLRTQ